MVKEEETQELVEDEHAVYRRKYRRQSLWVLAIFWFFVGEDQEAQQDVKKQIRKR